jgi:hypothetical protein
MDDQRELSEKDSGLCFLARVAGRYTYRPGVLRLLALDFRDNI